MKVDAGRDALTGHSLYLTELVAAGPDADERAEQVRAELVARVTESEHPRTDATIDELMERHIAEAKLGRQTRDTYRGKFKINGPLDDPELLDIYCAELACCREHCTGRPTIVKHWTPAPHRCDDRCQRHVCRPLADWTVRQIRWMLHGAYERAIRRKWAATNPMEHAEPPSQPAPPTTADTARIINAAGNTVDYDRMVWIAIMTGACSVSCAPCAGAISRLRTSIRATC